MVAYPTVRHDPHSQADTDRRQTRSGAPSIAHSPTQAITDQASTISSKPIIISASPNSPQYASVRLARRDEPFHQIQYNPVFARDRDYIIGHECGHIIRHYSTEPAIRRRPASGPANSQAALDTHANDIDACRARAPPGIDVDSMVRTLYLTTLGTLISGPADAHIEGWLYHECPGLRDQQARGLRHQALLGFARLRAHAECAPRGMRQTAATLTYTLAQELAEVTRQPDLAEPFRPLASEQDADALRRILHDVGDQGHAGDVETTDRWADYLGLQGWYYWLTPED